jgi:drug/metabolite transporter superfamily protein YnfA
MNVIRSIGLFANFDWLGAVIVALGVAVIFFSPRRA